MSSAPRTFETSGRGTRLALALTVVIVSAAPFVRAVGFPFLEWDDDLNFVLNPHIRGFSAENLRWMWSNFHVGHYMPLTWMSCALDYEIAGLDSRWFHGTNIALHAATALFLFFALVELLRQSEIEFGVVPSAAIGALFFAVHPLRVESVAWATERRDVLSGVWLALTIWTWLRAQRAPHRRALWVTASLIAFAASLLSKVSGMALPLVLLVLDVWPLPRAKRGWNPLIVEKWPYFALSVAAATVGFLGQKWSTGVLADLSERSWIDRLAISSFALRSYLRHTLFPHDLSPLYEIPADFDPLQARYVASFLFVVITTGFLFVQRRRSNTLLALWTAWVSFGLLVAPVIGLVHAGKQISADRYTYLPSFAIAALVAAASARWLVGRRAWIAAPVLAAYGFVSWIQCGHWRDTRTLFERVVAIEPNNYAGFHKLGILAHQRGDSAAALVYYARALEIRPERGHADAYYDRAVSHFSAGQRQLGIDDLRSALRDDVAHPGALHALSQELLQRNDVDGAVEIYRRAVKERGESEVLLHGLGRTFLDAQRYDEALRTAEQLERLAPRSALGPRLAGLSHLYSGRFSQAESNLHRAYELEPTHAETLYALGIAISRQNREAQAREIFERVLELDPGHTAARQKLAR